MLWSNYSYESKGKAFKSSNPQYHFNGWYRVTPHFKQHPEITVNLSSLIRNSFCYLQQQRLSQVKLAVPQTLRYGFPYFKKESICYQIDSIVARKQHSIKCSVLRHESYEASNTFKSTSIWSRLPHTEARLWNHSCFNC